MLITETLYRGVCIPAVFSKTGGPGGQWGPGDREAPGPGPGLVKNLNCKNQVTMVKT